MTMPSAIRSSHESCIAFLLLFIGGSTIDLRAQTSDSEPSINSRVRITAPDLRASPVIGTIVEKGEDAWMLELEIPDRNPLEVPLATVTRLEVSRGLQKFVAKGFAYGALGGGVVGALMGFSMGDDDCSGESEAGSFCLEVMSAGDKAVAYGLALGLVGGAIGALSGLFPSETWEDVSFPRPALGLSLPNHGGVGAVLTVRF
jgi:hypothetical protein